MVHIVKHFTFCLLWLSGKSPLNCYFFFCSPSNVNQAKWAWVKHADLELDGR